MIKYFSLLLLLLLIPSISFSDMTTTVAKAFLKTPEAEVIRKIVKRKVNKNVVIFTSFALRQQISISDLKNINFVLKGVNFTPDASYNFRRKEAVIMIGISSSF